jgi:type II secretory pathway component PulF
VSEVRSNSNPDGSLRYANQVTVGGLHDTLAPHQWALLRVLAVADRTGISPLAMLEGLAGEVSGKDQDRVLDFAEKIESGIHCIEALVQVPRILPPSAMLLLEMAFKEGELAELFEVMLESYFGKNDDGEDDSQNLAPMLFRSAIYVFFVILLVSFISLKIIPEHFKMYEEFGFEPTELPIVTQLFVSLSNLIVGLWFVPVLLFLASIPWLWPVFVRYIRRFRPTRWRQSVYLKPVEQRYALALAALSSNSINSVLGWLVQQESLQGLFPRLNLKGDSSDEKQDAWQEVENSKLISSQESKAIDLASNGEVQAWLLRWTASSLQRRCDTRTSFFVRALVGFINVCLAFFVGLVCFAVYFGYLNLMERI